MTVPPFLHSQGADSIIAVKLQPRSSQNGICGVLGDALKIKVTAPPVDSAANKLLTNFLAETLGCPKGAVEITKGLTSRNKTVHITGLSPEAVLSKIQKYL